MEAVAIGLVLSMFSAVPDPRATDPDHFDQRIFFTKKLPSPAKTNIFGL